MQAEEALRLSNVYNRSLIEATLDPLATVDLDGKITDVNAATENVTGYSREELIGRDFTTYFTDEEKARTGLQQVFKEGSARDYPLQIHHRDGHVTPVLYNASVFRSEDGEVKGAFAAARDISELNKLEEQLRQSQKMEALGLLAGGVAHDFNNMLTAILGYTELLLDKVKDNAVEKHYAEVILESSKKAAALTSSLLTFSRKKETLLAVIDLNEVIKKFESFIRRLLSDNIEIHVICSEESQVIMADSGQLEQIVMNLTTNARDALQNAGKITIETRTLILDQEFVETHGYGTAGEYSLLSVADNGVGMDKETQRLAFDPFFTTKEPGKGTGLGLSVVYGIVKKHGGFINVYSEPGMGTVFNIYMPRIQAIPQAVKTISSVVAPQLEGTETILLGEDDAAVRELAARVLKHHGYQVIEAVDGQDAVNRFIEFQDSIQLVILDLIMPKKNGKEAHYKMRQLRPGLKTLFTSGYTRDTLNESSILDENTDFIHKPMSANELVAKVREMLDKGGAV